MNLRVKNNLYEEVSNQFLTSFGPFKKYRLYFLPPIFVSLFSTCPVATFEQ